jgi:hypothetical protein
MSKIDPAAAAASSAYTIDNPPPLRTPQQRAEASWRQIENAGLVAALTHLCPRFLERVPVKLYGQATDGWGHIYCLYRDARDRRRVFTAADHNRTGIASLFEDAEGWLARLWPSPDGDWDDERAAETLSCISALASAVSVLPCSASSCRRSRWNTSHRCLVSRHQHYSKIGRPPMPTTTSAVRFEPRDLAEQLAEHIDPLVNQLLPRGSYGQGRRYWRVGSVAGEPGQSLCVRLDGPKRGRWRDYASGDGGDALDLVAAVACRGDKAAACRWSLQWLGLGRLDTGEAEWLKRQAEQTRELRRRDAGREAERNAHDAKRLWLSAAPLEPGDAGWRYSAGRGSDLGELPKPPAALRLHPSLWNAESRRHWPALVAAICVPDGNQVNVHRIWLQVHGDGTVTKAPLTRPKLSMPGSYAGGCVRLWQGASRKPWRDMPDGETLVAGEGIEDVLPIVCARPEWRACAVLSVSSLASLELPSQVTRLIWIAQNDPRGSPAALALDKALRLHRGAGRRVGVIRPPAYVKDVAELAELGADAA